MGKIDQITFRMLINNLKSDDFEVVAETLEQLEKEKRPISIPPVYFISVAHPDPRIRRKAESSLAKMDDIAEIRTLTTGKETKDAVALLIEKYGHYKS